MSTTKLARVLLATSATTAILGGGASDAFAAIHTQSFACTGMEQQWPVPADVTQIHVDAIGAPGGTGDGPGASGGEAFADIAIPASVSTVY